ncbi:hypothetical protein L7F22_014174 [Adiantum nelumboides]|nr:hypothetical protein [Adiantum nelumboides]
MPAEDRLISCFLESLRDGNLHTQLFGKRHVTLDDFFDDALLYEDNCNLGGADAKDGGSDSSSHTLQHVNSEAIANLVLRRIRENPRVGGNAQRPVPVLGTQPPLPRAAAVRYVDVATSDLSQHQDLVPVGSYYEEEYGYHGHYSDELCDEPRELMFINQGPPRGPPMGRGRQSSTPGPGPCFKCGVEESTELQFHQKLIEHNQAFLEGIPPRLVHKLPPFHNGLEPIIEENQIATEQPELELREPPLMVPKFEDKSFGSAKRMTTSEPNVSQSIPSLDEELATQLWEEVREKLKGKTEDVKPPLTSIAHTKDANIHLDAIPSVSEDWENETMVSSPDTHLDTLPNYLGEYEARSEVFPIPTARSMKNKEQKDGANLQALMSAPVTCTLPLVDLLKVRPDLWENIAGLSKMGEFCKKHNIECKSLKPAGKETMKVPINTVAYMPKVDETGNTTLPLEHNDYKAIAILDTGAGVSIATKSVWEKWGKRALRKTRMQLQLADGKMARPLGIMEYVSVTSCGIIHDGVTTRVNLSTHEFRDVAKLPVADFESATTSRDKETSIGDEGENHFWLFEAEAMINNANQATLTYEKIEEFKNLGPIIEINEEDASQEWMHLLATIDTCAIPSQTHFCDEDGYDVMPIRVIIPVYTMEATLEDESSPADNQSSRESSEQKDFLYHLEEEFYDGDDIVSKEDLERV